jgi:hypothetical protein
VPKYTSGGVDLHETDALSVAERDRLYAARPEPCRDDDY